MKTADYNDTEGSFRLSVPAGWEVARDEEGGLLFSHGEGGGLLHVLPFARDDAEEIDPAEELYAFLEDQDIELEDDEVEDVELDAGGSIAICEYVAEEDDDAVFWMIGVTTGPGQLVFASFSCPAEDQEGEREAVLGMVRSLRVGPGAG